MFVCIAVSATFTCAHSKNIYEVSRGQLGKRTTGLGGRGTMGLRYRMGTVFCDSQVMQPIDCAKLVALYMCAHHTAVATSCTATLAVCVAL